MWYVRDLSTIDILNLIAGYLSELLARLLQMHRCVSVVLLLLIYTKVVKGTLWIGGWNVLFLDRLQGLVTNLASTVLG